MCLLLLLMGSLWVFPRPSSRMVPNINSNSVAPQQWHERRFPLCKEMGWLFGHMRGRPKPDMTTTREPAQIGSLGVMFGGGVAETENKRPLPKPPEHTTSTYPAPFIKDWMISHFIGHLQTLSKGGFHMTANCPRAIGTHFLGLLGPWMGLFCVVSSFILKRRATQGAMSRRHVNQFASLKRPRTIQKCASPACATVPTRPPNR